ncbi:MAG TPA: hypothetical protein VI299_03990 [Polyangiales bacterium]
MLAAAMSIAGCQQGRTSTMLAGKVCSESYALYKIANRWNFGAYDATLDRYTIDVRALPLWRSIEEERERTPQHLEEREAVRAYFDSLGELEPGDLTFTSVLESHPYDQDWKDEPRIMRIVDFERTGSFSGLSPYLGPLASIPTWQYGIATFQLNFAGETVTLRSSAVRKIFAVRRRYEAGIQVYLPRPELRARVRSLVLTASEPNYWNLGDDGIYVLIPKPARDRSRHDC